MKLIFKKILILFGTVFLFVFSSFSFSYQKGNFLNEKNSTLNIKEVESGASHTAAVVNDGYKDHLYMWGSNNYGQLGLGDDYNEQETVFLPKEVTTGIFSLKNGQTIKQVSLGNEFSSAVVTDENNEDLLYTWGNNKFGQLGLGDFGEGTERNTPTKVEIDEPKEIKQIELGGTFSGMVLKLDKGFERFYTWGDNSLGELGDGTLISKSTPSQLPQEWQLKSINTIYKQLSFGNDFSGVLLNNLDDGSTNDEGKDRLFVMGNNIDGQLYCDLPVSNQINESNLIAKDNQEIKKIFFGNDFSSAIISDDGIDNLYTWGSNDEGQLGLGIDDEKIVEPTKVNFGSEQTVSDVVLGSSFALAKTNDGTNDHVFSWGKNKEGELGLGNGFSKLKYKSPQEIKSNLSNVNQISLGGNSAIAIKQTDNDQFIYVWGDNANGQLGLGDEIDKTPNPTSIEYNYYSVNNDSMVVDDAVTTFETFEFNVEVNSTFVGTEIPFDPTTLSLYSKDDKLSVDFVAKNVGSNDKTSYRYKVSGLSPDTEYKKFSISISGSEKIMMTNNGEEVVVRTMEEITSLSILGIENISTNSADVKVDVVSSNKNFNANKIGNYTLEVYQNGVENPIGSLDTDTTTGEKVINLVGLNQNSNYDIIVKLKDFGIQSSNSKFKTLEEISKLSDPSAKDITTNSANIDIEVNPSNEINSIINKTEAYTLNVIDVNEVDTPLGTLENLTNVGSKTISLSNLEKGNEYTIYVEVSGTLIKSSEITFSTLEEITTVSNVEVPTSEITSSSAKVITNIYVDDELSNIVGNTFDYKIVFFDDSSSKEIIFGTIEHEKTKGEKSLTISNLDANHIYHVKARAESYDGKFATKESETSTKFRTKTKGVSPKISSFSLVDNSITSSGFSVDMILSSNNNELEPYMVRMFAVVNGKEESWDYVDENGNIIILNEIGEIKLNFNMLDERTTYSNISLQLLNSEGVEFIDSPKFESKLEVETISKAVGIKDGSISINNVTYNSFSFILDINDDGGEIVDAYTMHVIKKDGSDLWVSKTANHTSKTHSYKVEGLKSLTKYTDLRFEIVDENGMIIGSPTSELFKVKTKMSPGMLSGLIIGGISLFVIVIVVIIVFWIIKKRKKENKIDNFTKTIKFL